MWTFVLISLGNTQRSEIAVTDNKYIFNVIKKLPNVF